MIGKKWIYLERNTLHRQSVGRLRRRERHQGLGLSVLIGVGNFINEAKEWEEYSRCFGEGVGISKNWGTAHFLTFYGCPQNCHGPGGCVI